MLRKTSESAVLTKLVFSLGYAFLVHINALVEVVRKPFHVDALIGESVASGSQSNTIFCLV
jgi:hypothetical protein